MRSPALAMGWEFRRRHLWALIAMAGYLLALAAIKLLFLRPMEPIRLDPPDGRAAVVITPLTATYFYRSEEHTSELQSPCNLVCRLLLEKKNNNRYSKPLTYSDISV